jgi:hypothetical protein
MVTKPFSVQAFAAVIPNRDASWASEIPASLKRRNPRIWQMAYIAVARLLKNTGQPPRSMAVGTALGALDETKGFLDGIFKDGLGSPINFIASVHNSMAGKLALEFKVDGPNLTLCDGQNSFASAVASCALFPNSAFPCCVVAVDEHIPLLSELVLHCSPECKAFLADDGEEAAIALLLDRQPLPNRPSLRAVGPVALGCKKADLLALELVSRFDSADSSSPTVVSLENCRSFISTPLQVFDRLAAGVAGRFIVPSFSPSSKACSAVEVHL